MADTSVKVSFIGDSSHLKHAIDDVDGKVDGFKSKLGGIAKVAAVAGVAALGTELFAAGKAFAEDEKAAASLAKTLENMVGATKAEVDQVEKFINKTQNASGVLDDQLRPALETLLRGTGDVTKAQKLMGLAMDISAGTGKDLGSVTDALSKAANGNFKALKALDPALADLIKDGASTDEIMSSLAQTFEGQTARAADTTAGKIAIAKARFSDLQEEIGAKVVPAMAALAEFISTKLIPAIEKIVGWLQEHKGVAIAAAAVIGTLLVAAFIAWAAAAIAAAAATLAAMAPVIAITVAIAALVAGIIWAYNNWGWFHDAVDKAWQILQVVADFIRVEVVPRIVSIGEVLWEVISTWAEWNIKVVGFVIDVIQWVTGIPGKIKDAFVNVWEIITEPFKAAFDWIMDKWNSTVGKVFDKISSVGGFIGGAVGKIPGFASGGMVGGPIGAPQLAIVHGGERILTPGQQGGGVTVIVQGSVWGTDLERIVARAVVNASNNQGGLPIRIRAAS